MAPRRGRLILLGGDQILGHNKAVSRRQARIAAANGQGKLLDGRNPFRLTLFVWTTRDSVWRMRALTRYIFSQLVTAVLFITVALTFAIWLTQSLRLIHYIVNRGLPASTFFAFVGLLLPSFLGIVLPIATFVSVLFVYNKLTMDSELVVLRAAGLSQYQLAKPALILSVLVTLIVFSISLFFLPWSFRHFKDLQYNIRNDYSAVLLQEGVFNTISNNITVYVRERSADGQMHGILVHDSRDPAKPVTMMAEDGAMVPGPDGPRVVMTNGNRQEVERESGRLSLLYFDSYTVELSQYNKAVGSRWREPKERYIHELLFPGDDSEDQRYRNELLSEGHQRLAGPLYTMAFVLVALAALLSGEFNRRGQARRVVLATVIVAGLEGATFSLHDFATRLPLTTPAMYVTVLLVMAVSLWLLLRQRPRSAPSLADPAAAS